MALVALYLRGAPRPADPPRRAWPETLAALRREGGRDPARALRAAGMDLPATLLESGALLDWADGVVESGAALTPVAEGYPLRWLEALGALAPPALWRSGATPSLPWVGAVGSRVVSEGVAAYMADVGERTAAIGRGLVSGGAVGCDAAAEAAALRAGGAVLRILPHGLGRRADEEDGAVQVALAAPDEPFSRALAMERNALIYAAADATVVGHARMRQGGTWHGATDALRRRLGRVLVRPDDSTAARALRSLGAEAMEDPADLDALLAQGPSQKPLFAYERGRR